MLDEGIVQPSESPWSSPIVLEAGLKLNSKEVSFAAQEVKILGHLVSSNGVRPDPDKIKADNLGFAKTYDRIRKRFYWLGNTVNVVRYVITAAWECQRRKSVPQPDPPDALAPSSSCFPFHRIETDLQTQSLLMKQMDNNSLHGLLTNDMQYQSLADSRSRRNSEVLTEELSSGMELLE
ncbi:hypothetical protein TNCV_4300241 [Trichonephila clavipes]|nr:hypothetical protein TNCV_4300241 [Trichonephila clavipes]